MNKTMEELANSIAIDFIREHKGKINNDAPLTHECVQYVIKQIFAMPLAQRLTDAEKERVRKTYKAMSDYGKKKDVVCADCANYAARVGLERIFGKEFFKEEKL